MSSSARCWIAFLTAALLTFYIGHIPLHISLEEHSHGSGIIENDSHSHHQHDSEHHSHPNADHSVVFVSKSKTSHLPMYFVVPETAVLWEAPISLPVSFSDTLTISNESPPNRFSPRGPPFA